MTVPWLDALVAASHTALQDLPASHEARAYLRSRGCTDAYLVQYRLGWLPEPKLSVPCPPELWTWLTRYAWDKLVFPLTDPFGAAMGVQLRSPREKGYVEWFEAQAKPLTPLCFGLHTALPAAFQSERLVLTEGVFDFFALRPYATEVVAILTSTPTLILRQLLARYVRIVVMATDMDAAGRRGAYRVAGLPCPPEYKLARDRVFKPAPLPPYQVLIPAYSAHDPSDLFAQGKQQELRRLATYGVPTLAVS